MCRKSKAKDIVLVKFPLWQNTMNNSNLGGNLAYIYCWCYSIWREGSQGSTWSRNHKRMWFTGLFFSLFSLFLVYSRTTCLEVALHKGCWAFILQLSIKKMHIDLSIDQSYRDIFQMTLTCANLTQTQPAQTPKAYPHFSLRKWSIIRIHVSFNHNFE